VLAVFADVVKVSHFGVGCLCPKYST
jgi:hypothetical protein